MKPSNSVDPTQICEEFLREQISHLKSQEILPSWVTVAERLLSRSVEMKEVYEELHGRLGNSLSAQRIFLETILNSAAFWDPEKISEQCTIRKKDR